MSQIKILNYAFPAFGLSIQYNNESLIRAEFFDLVENREMYVGEPNSLTARLLGQLNAYVNNPQFIFDLPLVISGTLHQITVWKVMPQIKSGSVLTYGEIAKQINSAPRAIGGACGKNPFPVIIPCHRIVAANNKLGGFNSGNIFFNLGIKKWLLNHEGIAI